MTDVANEFREFRDKLRARLISEEGWKNQPYVCPAGKLTVGVGHNVEAHPIPQGWTYPLTDVQVLQLLEADIDRAVHDAHTIFGDTLFDALPVGRRIALADLSFQLGATKLEKFHTFVPLVRYGKWQEAADDLANDTLVARQTPRRIRGVADLLRGGAA